MKKQFFRVKQLADQTFLRAEKSKQLSDELQEADQKVEYLRGALAAVSKRLPQPNTNTNSNSVQEKEHFEKRLKKLVEYQLGIVMKEYGTRKEDTDSEDTLLRPVLHKCGKAQMELAREMSEHECKIENMVSQPIQTVLETDIPAILKTKRTLSKLVLDKDSATNRFQTASKHGTKNESIRDEMEEAEQKVEHCRDALAAEMFSLLRRESEFAQFMLQLMKLQRGYHESALHTLEELIPELEKEIGNSPVKAIYGCPLDEHLRLSKRQIALPLELCVCALWELGMKEEGLFRVAGGASRVRRMKLSIDSGCFSPPLQFEYRDVHVIASALKSYLRELPEPLLTYNLYGEWVRLARYPTDEQRIEAMHHVLQRLPEANFDNLRYLIKFLAALSQNPQNKMSTSNIAIVMAPNLLWSVQEISNGIDMNSATIVNSIVEILLSHVDVFFPGEIQIYHTFKRDDLFPDLVEFDRPVITVITNESHEDLLEGSPKPISRKKNKPAPIPPNIYATIHRTNKNETAHGGEQVEKNKPPHIYATIQRTNKNETTAYGGEQDVVQRRKSLEKTDISPPITTETTANINVLTINQIVCNKMKVDRPVGPVGSVGQVGCVGPVSSVGSVAPSKSKQLFEVDRPMGPVAPVAPVIPVAAPRTSLLQQSDVAISEVQLRRPAHAHTVPSKPAIPERPATLRPSSFRASKTSSNKDEGSVETAHVYNVPDKQQVSIIKLQQLQQMKEKGHDCQMAEKERFLMMNSSLERLNVNVCDEQQNNGIKHHARTLSDGDLIDSMMRRPPRPQPPPPPPPVPTTQPQPQVAIVPTVKSDKESTDL